MKVPDHERNRGWLGRIVRRFGVEGYPKLMLMTLCETGTRGLLGAVFGPAAAGERAYALQLVHLLTRDMLLLTDRGFDGNDVLKAVVATGAQVLARCKASRRPPVLAVLEDGSYLTRIAGLTDHRTDPAGALIGLYHERWEIESAYYALRHTLLKGRVLRSKDPAGITQEMWALLVLYQAIRAVMVTAVETVPGTDPDRAGFTIAVEAARDSVTTATGILPATDAGGKLDLAGRIGAAVLDGLLPPRRPRSSVRMVKCGISRYHSWNADNPPLTSVDITAIEITMNQPDPPWPRQTPTRTRPARPARTSATPPPPRPDGRWKKVTAIMTTVPDQQWRARDIARALGVTGEKALNSFCVQISTWARRGLLTKTAPATYTIT